jgi:GGDEF domain-containing protein
LARDKAAALRDRELTALARAEAAALRDRERAGDGGAEIGERAEEISRGATADRAAVFEGRARAALAREQAALDREQTARDRLRARGERDALLDQLAIAETDPLTNDSHGHAAGDALLQRAVRAIRAHLCSYDMIVRIGGDEFLCVRSGATLEGARQRFGAVHAALAADPDSCAIKVGFAALTPQDVVADLIERADADLPNRRAG